MRSTPAVFRLFFIGAALLAPAVVAPAAATAQDCGVWGGAWGGWGGGFWNQPAFGVGGSLYGSGYVPVPPYYSIHPPVYYSGRVYRTYGDSPFAYPPERMRSSRSYSGDALAAASYGQARPQMILNPYFEAAPAAEVAPPAPAAADAAPDFPPNVVPNVPPQSVANPHVTPAVEKAEANPLPAPTETPTATPAVEKSEANSLPAPAETPAAEKPAAEPEPKANKKKQDDDKKKVEVKKQDKKKDDKKKKK